MPLRRLVLSDKNFYNDLSGLFPGFRFREPRHWIVVKKLVSKVKAGVVIVVKSVYKYSPPYIYMKQEDYPSVKHLGFIANDINNSDFHCFIFIRNMQSSFVDLLKRNGAVDIYWKKRLDSQIDKEIMAYYPSLEGGVSAIVEMKKPFSVEELKNVYYQLPDKNYPIGEIIITSSRQIPDSVLDAFFEYATGESDIPSKYLDIIFDIIGLWSYACEYTEYPEISPSDVVIIGQKSSLTKDSFDWGAKFDPITGQSIE